MDLAAPRIRSLPSDVLTPAEVGALRALLVAAFAGDDAGFGEDDWVHALGGTHFLAEVDGRIVGHASVVERELRVAGRPLRTGYVEAVAVAPDRQGEGIGAALMAAVGEHVRTAFELGALATGAAGFYERLGWRTWQGPSGVRTATGLVATPDDDGGLLVLETPRTPPLDTSSPIDCDWRAGDAW